MGHSTDKLAPALSSTREKALIPIFFIAALLYWLGLYLYVPTLPLYAKSINSNLAVIGVVLSMYGLWQLIIRLPLGIIADWVGIRRPFIIGSFILAATGALIMANTNDINTLGFGRAITRLAAGSWVPMVVMFSSFYRPSEVIRAIALLTLASSLGRIIGTASNGFLNEIGGYPLAFYLSAIVSGVAILMMFFVPEQRQPSQTPSGQKLETLFLRRDVLLPSLLSAAVHYADWTTTFSFIPILARQYGANDIVLSILMSLNLGILMLGNLIATTLVNRIGYRKLVILSFLLIIGGVAGAALSHSLILLFPSQLAIGLGYGIGYPVLMGASINYVDDKERNSATGLHQSVYAVGMFAGPWISGVVASRIGIQPMLGITAGALLAAAFAGIRLLANQ